MVLTGDRLGNCRKAWGLADSVRVYHDTDCAWLDERTWAGKVVLWTPEFGDVKM